MRVENSNLLKYKYTKADDKKFRETFGVLLDSIDSKKLGTRQSIITCVQPLIRNIVLAITLSYLSNHNTFQLHICFNLFLFNLGLQFDYNPQNSKAENVRKIVNEACLLLFTYQIFLFTDFVASENYPMIGNSAIRLVIANIAFNFSITIVLVFYSGISYLKQALQSRKIKRVIKERNQRRQRQLMGLK